MDTHRLENQNWSCALRCLGGLSLFVLLLSFLALDDITTDSATEFPMEYSILAFCGAYFMLVIWRLEADGYRRAAMLCGVLLLGNALGVVNLTVCGRPADPVTGYLMLCISFVALFIFSLLLLLVRGWADRLVRRTRAG